MSTKKTEAQEPRVGINRYHRQELIAGWKQQKIQQATAAVVGSDLLAQFTAAALVSVGFGSVILYGDAKGSEARAGEFLPSLTDKKAAKVDTLEDVLSRINPLARVKGIPAGMHSAPMAQLLGVPSVIIEATNNPRSKAVVLEYAQSKKIPVISLSANSASGDLYLQLPGRKEQAGPDADEKALQGAIPSQVLGGIATEEARKIVMPLSPQETPLTTLRYSLASPQRFSGTEESAHEDASLGDKHVLVVGAGALGNFAGIGLALAGVGTIDILDFDTVEATNLNRQLLFYDAIGEKKATALAAKLKRISPQSKVQGLVGKLDEHYQDYFESRAPDLILDCVDSFGTRALINAFAVKYKIPLVSGGTSPSAGQVAVYEPGTSACLDCRMKVDQALAQERTSHSCLHAVQPSVIMTNEIIGGLMIGEARAVLAPQAYGPAVRKMLKYDSLSPARAGLVGSDAPCRCTRDSLAEWLQQIMKKA